MPCYSVSVWLARIILVMSLCQSCRSLSRIERCPGCTTRRRIYFAPHKPWTQEISKVTVWPRRRAVVEFRLCVGHDCLGAHLHRIAIRPDPYCTLCSLHEPMARNHLGQRTTLSNKTECERYWEARTKMMENWLCYFIITIFLWLPLAVGLYI